MDRNEVARVLEEISWMLELAGESVFKVRAYDAGARAIRGFSGDLAEAVRTKELLKVQGIGSGLFSNIEALVRTGSLPYHEELSAAFPPGLRECLRIPGVGARKAKVLRERLGIDSLAALERACREGNLASLPGFGAKSEERIRKGIEVIRRTAGLHRYAAVRRQADEFVEKLRETRLASRIELAGSLRRRREIVRDINVVAASDRPEELARAFAQPPELGATARTDLRVVSEDEFAAALLHFTGSKEHNMELRTRANERGLELNESGLFRGGAGGERVPAATEEEIYRGLGLEFVEPELREGRGEIEAAARRELPRLLEPSDVRGLIHVHTTESDGKASLEEMVAAARDAGYEYAAITDHSQAAAYARGLTPDRVLRQREEIRAVEKKSTGFRIFHGTEADILADGSIDFGDEFLGVFDLVVASVHSRFGLSREEQTRRLVRAVENPRVSILGHPTGRLLLERDGIDADMEEVLAAAGRSGCAVEINGSPHRLDLDWRLCRFAAEDGVLLSIGPDAHSVRELGNTAYAVGVARKGWVTAASTLNAKGAADLAAWLEARRGAPLPS